MCSYLTDGDLKGCLYWIVWLEITFSSEAIEAEMGLQNTLSVCLKCFCMNILVFAFQKFHVDNNYYACPLCTGIALDLLCDRYYCSRAICSF